jgi:hypothetical protein
MLKRILSISSPSFVAEEEEEEARRRKRKMKY